METQAYFTNIRSHISAELNKASSSIYVAVAWFTDQKLFSILCDKAKAGLDVKLIVVDDAINRAHGVNYQELETAGGQVYLINETSSGTLMHNKFCVIDASTTITGSYNWSKKAQGNHENITITTESEELATMFLDEFKRIKVQYHGLDPLKRFDGVIICKRLTIIDGLIELDEYEQIALHLEKINEFDLTKEVDHIVEVLTSSDFISASFTIREYLVKMKSLTHFKDEDLEQLKWEIKYLEIEIVTLENEKSSIEKLISDFVHTYTMKFGELLVEILKLKKEKLRRAGNDEKSTEYEQAEEEYNNFKNQYKHAKKEKINELSEDELDDLKKLYRKATILCHPDKFTDEDMKAKAHKVFVELQDAYSKNDIERVREILDKLENGIYDIEEKASISNREQLLKRLEYLRLRRDEITNELIRIKNEKNYRDIVTIKNMDSFFEEERVRLENELKNLKK